MEPTGQSVVTGQGEAADHAIDKSDAKTKRKDIESPGDDEQQAKRCRSSGPPACGSEEGA